MTAQEKSAARNDFFIGSLSVIELGESVVRAKPRGWSSLTAQESSQTLAIVRISSAPGAGEGPGGDPVHAVVADELCLRDRVVVGGRRDDPHARPHERVELLQVLRRAEQR